MNVEAVGRRYGRHGVSALLLALLVGCGGGGAGGSGAAAVPAPLQLAAGEGMNMESTSQQPSASQPAQSAPQEADVTVNATTEGQQGQAQLTRLPGGGWVAVWLSAPAGSGAGEVRLRRLDASGQPQGAEVLVAARGGSPGVAAFADGGYVVTWSASPAMYQAQGMAQVYGAQGAPAGSPIVLASTLFKYVPRPMALPDGSFVIAADTTAGRDGPEYGLVARYGRDGTPLGTPVRLDAGIDPVTGAQDSNSVHDLTVAPLAGGGFMAAWIAAGSATSELRLARFDATAALQGAVRTVASGGNLRTPSLASLATGALALGWESADASGGASAWLELFDAAGVSRGRHLVESDAGAWSVQPRLAALDAGGVVATWRVVHYGATTMERTHRARRFDESGAPAGELLQLGNVQLPLEASGHVADSIAVAPGGGAAWMALYGGYGAASGWDVLGSLR